MVSVSSLPALSICFRISPAIDQSSRVADLNPGWDTPAPEENMMPGTRRLDTDVTEYEYVDTYPRYTDQCCQSQVLKRGP